MKKSALAMGLIFYSTLAHANLLLEISGELISFTEDWVSVKQGRTTYTINRKMISEEENNRVSGPGQAISFAIEPSAVIQAHVAKK